MCEDSASHINTQYYAFFKALKASNKKSNFQIFLTKNSFPLSVTSSNKLILMNTLIILVLKNNTMFNTAQCITLQFQ